MPWKVIADLFAGLVSRLASFLGAYWLGKKSAENKGLQREIERGKRDLERAAEAKRAGETVRALGDGELDAKLHRFSRKPSTPRLD